MTAILTAWTLLKRYWPYALGSLALALLGVQTLRVHSLTADLAACAAGRAADRASYTAAQTAAAKLAADEKAATEAHYKELADNADHAAQAALADANARADAYIAAHRVRASAAGSAPGGPTPAAEDHGPGGSDGPGAATELVTVSAADIRVCTANTTRLESVRDWAVGLAVTVPDD